MAHRIVVVDDQPDTLELLRDALTDQGYDVECAPAVDAGLHEIRDATPDLIIVDLWLSNDQRWLSGWDVVRLARSHAELYRLPILVISADPAALRSRAAEAKRLGNVKLLPKPFRIDQLLAEVQASLPSSPAIMAAEPQAAG
jgi:DNA-binding response OmpR family regulator